MEACIILPGYQANSKRSTDPERADHGDTAGQTRLRGCLVVSLFFANCFLFMSGATGQEHARRPPTSIEVGDDHTVRLKPFEYSAR